MIINGIYSHHDHHNFAQLVKDEIDDIRESLDRLEAESQRRKNKLLEQVHHYEEYDDGKYTTYLLFNPILFVFSSHEIKDSVSRA